MDTPTQAVLGAAFGQALAGRRLGREAALWGAVGGLLPDLDMVLAAVNPVGDMLYHRGPTHALWFGPVVGPILAFLLWRTRGGRAPGRLGAWVTVMVAALFTHPLLDLFTTYGTQLLAPFSRTRFSLDAVAIVDPTYTIVLVLALLVGWWRGVGSRVATASAWLALVLSSGYLLYCWRLDLTAKERVRAALAHEGVTGARVDVYPTLLQPYYRRVVVRNGHEVRVGWVSLWNGRPIEWARFHEETHPLIDATRASRVGRIFEWFADRQTVGRVRPDPVAPQGSEVEVEDLRFGLPADPQHGLWGIRARYDGAGHPLGEPRRFGRRPPGAIATYVRQILHSTFN